LGGEARTRALGGHKALLHLIGFDEPFGLSVIEAMACGTPVIAYNHGSVPEIIDDGVTGFIVEDEMSAVAALRRLPEISRETVRATFERRFTARRMAEDYLSIYRDLSMARRPRLRIVG